MENDLNVPLWLLICQSDLIAKANVISDLNKKDLKPNSYLSFEISISEIYKGTTIPETIPMKHYIYEDTQFPLSKIINNEIIIFAIDFRHDNNSKCFYFVEDRDEPSFMAFKENIVEQIKSELELQKRLLNDFLENPKKFPNEDIIQQFIDNVLDPKKAEHPYKKIESLNLDSVPALIKHMDDRRELPVKHIQLANKSKNAFEAYRHYSPQQVIDFIAAILNHITRIRFGFIYNGEIDSERDKTYKKWIIWLERREFQN